MRSRHCSARMTMMMAVLLALVFLGAGTAKAVTFAVYPAPKDCLEQARKEGNTLNLYDWAEWWPEEIYQGFTKEYGIKIVRDNYASEDEALTKLRLNPKLPYDLIYVGPRMFYLLKQLGIAQPLNRKWLPNTERYLNDASKYLWFDPEHHYYAALYRWFTAYVYNTKYVDPNDPLLPSFKILFEGKKYAGRITMLDNMAHTIGVALKYLGYSFNSDSERELNQARDLLLKQKPMVIAYDSWPRRMVVEEEAWIAHSWLGEGWFYHLENKAVMGAMPPEGSITGVDTLMISRSGPHPACAHLFLDYLHRPEVNAKLVETIGYSPVMDATVKLLPEEMLQWPGVVPSPEYLKKCDYLRPQSFTGKGLELRGKIWEEIKK